jgi:hypothetical protein
MCSSWNLVGLALRLAYGQGLHIRNDDVKLDSYQREVFARNLAARAPAKVF